MSMTIISSSKDYGTQQILVLWDGEFDNQTVFDYVKREYSVITPFVVDVTVPTDFKGLRQFGTVLIEDDSQLK